MSDSIWKKEISFSRKPKAPKEASAEPVVRDENQSVWKKELSLGKKQKAPKTPKAKRLKEAKPKSESTPFWKKEISLGKKQPSAPTLAEIVADEPRELTEQHEAVWEREAGVQTPPKQSIWKKEISLARNKSADDEVARLVELATQAVDPSFAP